MMFFEKYKSHYKEILKLGIPIVIGQLGVIIVGFADNIMVGQYDSVHLAAASFVNSVFNVPILFGLGFAYGLTPLVGQAFGRGDTSKVGQYLKNSLMVNFFIGVFLSLVMGVLYANLDKLGQPAELLPIIRPYFLLQLFSLIFVMLFNAFKQFSDGITDTLTPMFVMLAANLFNIVGNYILIYGKLGLPDMGLTGAGISTLASRVLMLVAFAIIFSHKKQFKPYFKVYKHIECNRKDALELNRMGWMVGIQMGLETALFSVAGVMIGWLGTASLAAHQTLATVSTLGFMMYYGIGAAISVRVSNYFGRDDMINLRKTVTAGFHIIVLLAIGASSIFFLGRNLIGPIFTASIEVHQIVVTLIPILLLYQIGDAIQITFANSLRGIGDVNSMAIISVIGYIFIALPLCYICGFIFDWGIQGIWIGFPVGLITAGVLFCLRFYYKIGFSTNNNTLS